MVITMASYALQTPPWVVHASRLGQYGNGAIITVSNVKSLWIMFKQKVRHFSFKLVRK